jgi:hypothetical protein
MKANRNTAIVSFSRKDVEASQKSESGLEIISGGTISDRDLYYTPQKATIIDIKHDFFKNGDVVYLEYTVWNAGTGTDKGYNTRKIFGDGQQIQAWCFHPEIFCKIEDGKILPDKKYVFCEAEYVAPSTTIHVIQKKQKISYCIVKSVHPDSEIKEGDRIVVETVGLYNNSRVEGKWIYIIPIEKVVCILAPVE